MLFIAAACVAFDHKLNRPVQSAPSGVHIYNLPPTSRGPAGTAVNKANATISQSIECSDSFVLALSSEHIFGILQNNTAKETIFSSESQPGISQQVPEGTCKDLDFALL